MRDANRTHDGRPLKLLTIVDAYTRECLAIAVARRLRSRDVLWRLQLLFLERELAGSTITCAPTAR